MITGAGLIVNADDLGIHPRISAGIIEAFEHGILTSATLLVTTPFAAEAAHEACRAGLPTGLHFSLTLGRTVAAHSSVPDLIDGDGNLKLSATKLLLLGDPQGRSRDLYRQIACEIEAQFGAAEMLGVSLTHVDSHQHVHMNPHIFRMLEDAAERHGVPSIRISREPWYGFEWKTDVIANGRRLNPAKLVLVQALSRGIVPRLRTVNSFFGLMYSGHLSHAAFVHVLARMAARGGIHEIGLHPGRRAASDENAYPRTGYNAFISSLHREQELKLLTDPQIRTAIETRGVRLLSYRDLGGVRAAATAAERRAPPAAEMLLRS